MLSNGEKMIKTDSTPLGMECLNAMRVLTMGWVVLGHTALYTLNYSGKVRKSTVNICPD